MAGPARLTGTVSGNGSWMVVTRSNNAGNGSPSRNGGPIPVVVLNWNGLADTLACVDALLETTGIDFRVILVDNGSEGDDFERLQARYRDDSRVEVRRNPDNVGFARGVNAVLAELLGGSGQRPEYVALLNNDAVPDPQWLPELEKTAGSSGAGAVASRMIRHDDPGKLDNAGHVFLNTGEVLPRGAGRPPGEYDAPAPVAGACAGAGLFRLSMLDDIGLFDEYFDTGYEDAELGLRAMLAGYRQLYNPGAVVHHKVGASVDKIRNLRYAVRLQVNINYTYLKLMPLPVMAWNLPWILTKAVAMLIVPLLAGRFRLFWVQVLALKGSFRLVAGVPKSRRQFRKRRISSLDVIRRQQFFMPHYWMYFKHFILGRKKTAFER